MIEHNPFAPPAPNESPCIEHVLYWVWEREAIRIAKENGHTGELTKDPILRQYRFCNVRRRDDRVSKWIINNLLNREFKDMWFVAAIARFVNWPPTLANLMFENAIPSRAEEFSRAKFCEVIDAITASGQLAWTSAYMVRAVGALPGKKSAVVADYLQSAIDNREAIRSAIATNSVENAITAIHDCFGFGTFMAGQVVNDLVFTETLSNATDRYTYAPMGPGSQKGLNRLWGRPLNQPWKQSEFNATLRDVTNCIEVELKLEEPLILHDTQNVFCEIFKYWRALYNEGRPRNKYRPETAY